MSATVTTMATSLSSLLAEYPDVHRLRTLERTLSRLAETQLERDALAELLRAAFGLRSELELQAMFQQVRKEAARLAEARATL